MRLHYEKSVLLNPKFLFYFVPQKFDSNKTFPLMVSLIEKAGLEIEGFGYRLKDLQQNFFLCLENRFWVHDNTPFFESQNFSLCFQGLDRANRTLRLSKKKEKLFGYGYFDHITKTECTDITLNEPERRLIKSRLLRLTKGGFVCSCSGIPAYVIKSSSFYKFRKYNSYRGWFSLNLPYYGFVSYFCLVRLERKIVSLFNSKRYGNRYTGVGFYYLKNRRSKYFYVLAKPKNILGF